MAVTHSERPSRWRLTYAMELVAIDGSGRGANRVLNLPINPTSVAYRSTPGNDETWTAGGVALEDSGFVSRDITIQGSPGLEPKRGWKLESTDPHKPETGFTFRDGNELFAELWRWFEFYAELKRRQDVASKWFMVWHDFRRGWHWVVQPKEWDTSREAKQHRLHHPFEFRLKAVSDYDALALGGVAGFFADVRSATDEIAGLLLDAAGYLADIDSFRSEADQTFLGGIQQVISAGGRILDGLAAVSAGVRDTLNFENRLAAQMALLVDGLAYELSAAFGKHADGAAAPGAGDPWAPGNQPASRAVAAYRATQQMSQSLDRMRARRDLWEPDLPEARARRRALRAGATVLSDAEVAAPGVLAIGARATAGSAYTRALARRREAERESLPTYTGTRAYVVAPGDTLLSIALEEVGARDAWTDIAAINSLRHPYTSRARTPGTVAPGDTILVPTFGTSKPSPRGTRAEIEREALGVDFELTAGGLVYNAAGDGYRTVEGVDCYLQSINEVRFGTKFGDNLTWPSVGILAPVGSPNRDGTPSAVALSVRRACLTDPRTAEVVDLEFVDGGDTIDVVATLRPQGFTGTLTVQRRA